MIPLQEIKTYLQNNEVPKTLQLDECTFISDTKTFITTNIEMLENNKGNKVFKPYYDRLLMFYNKVKN